MKIAAKNTDYEVRRYRDADEPGVLELLRLSLGEGPAGERSSEFFHWKHISNPFGRSLMLVAESQSTIIGLRAFMRWRFTAGGQSLSAVQAVDTATHPDFQGIGVFSTLTREALEQLSRDTDFVYNTPNDKSLPGYLKMGWSSVGTVRVSVRVQHPVKFVRHMVGDGESSSPGVMPAINAQPAEDLLGSETEISELLGESDPGRPEITTSRSFDYLRWRYVKAPNLDYRAIGERRGGRIRGLAIFRVRARRGLWETALLELILPKGERAMGRRLVRRVLSSASTDHAICHFPGGTIQARTAFRSGFLRTRRGVLLVARPLRRNVEPSPQALGSWALSLGDMEVF